MDVKSPAVEPYARTTLAQPALKGRQKLLQETKTTEVSCRGADGEAFRLSLREETTGASASYGQSGALRGRRGQAPQEASGSGAAFADAFGAMTTAVEGFRRLLQQMLVAVDGSYAARWASFNGLASDSVGAAHVGAIESVRTLTVSMDAVDTEYWSVENTAGRLRDFALSLFGGGDRTEHLQKMLSGMEQGYEEAAQAFGGTLPGIARETVDLAARMLTEWAREETIASTTAQGASAAAA